MPTRVIGTPAKPLPAGLLKSVHNKYNKVRAVLRYACDKKGQDRKQGERVLQLMRQVAELPDRRDKGEPDPILPADFKALLSVADTKWKAILLTALNCCYYPVDVRTLPLSAVVDKSGKDRKSVYFRRAKKDTARVAVLWERTRKAIAAYLKERENDCETLFICQYETPFTAGGFYTAYCYLRDNAESTVKFNQIRDGAYSAAVNARGVELKECQILAGHKFEGGDTDEYVKRHPRIVENACKAIEAHYFGRGR